MAMGAATATEIRPSTLLSCCTTMQRLGAWCRAYYQQVFICAKGLARSVEVADGNRNANCTKGRHCAVMLELSTRGTKGVRTL
jgi:hypothetical protein